ncbi:response regulator [candidate division CSSED10-310 bacterium]|uniref:histidine kinase n=1 Tax=candidate division CSSED10-310 bacterium TaxID=2855610 RepID=A0ABV6Z0F8_UNCC1
MTSTSTILIVEDTKFEREVLKSLLSKENYNLIFAQDGEEALAIAPTLQPDLIILDVILPGLDGFAVCRHFRKDVLLAEVPIIMVTALGDRDSRLRGLKAGADNFIAKPYDQEELSVTVQTILQLNRYRHMLHEKNKFQWVVERVQDGFIIINDEDQILFSNTKGQQFLELAPDSPEPMKESFLHLAQKKYICEPQIAWNDWPTGQTTSQGMKRYLIRPETETTDAFWLHVDILDNRAGKEGGLLVHLQDVSKEMSLLQDVWTFHALIEHKMRTPLTTMIGSFEFLLSGASKLARTEIVQMAELGFKSANTLYTEIENIFKYIKSMNELESKTRSKLSLLSPVIKNICRDLKLNQVTVSVPDNFERKKIRISLQNLEIIIHELLENSKKFHPAMSPTLNIDISFSEPEKVQIQICDDGVTLTPDQLARVWIPYYQGEKIFTGQIPGIGLGMSLVAQLVWTAGGSCTINNRDDGPGIIIKLTLPLAD